MKHSADSARHFLIIGAQKCGTTWLHQQLASHPEVFMSSAKDDEFFSYLPRKDPARYREKFASAGVATWYGDSCASYFWSPRPGDQQPQGFNPEIAQTIYEQLGAQVRLIVLLKDPVERSLSAYLHHIAHQSLDCNIALLDAPARLGLIALSRYGHHLRHWLGVFPSEQILILPDPGAANSQQLLERSCAFLGIDPQHTFHQPEHSIFPGLRRLRRDDGLWVALGQRGVESAQRVQRPLPLIQVQQQDYVRLVHPAEIAKLRDILREDSADFADQLQQLAREDAAFQSWQTWPQA